MNVTTTLVFSTICVNYNRFDSNTVIIILHIHILQMYRVRHLVHNLLLYLECRECVGCNIKSGHFYIFEKIVEIIGEKNYFGEWFVADTFSQHHATV